MLRTRKTNLRWVDIDMAEVELDKLILHFAQSNKAEGKSPRTIVWYSDMLNDFARFLESKGCKGALSEFDIETVKEFVVYEQERGHVPIHRTGQGFGVWQPAIANLKTTGNRRGKYDQFH